mmetsp:Transcript_8048/g.19044  ORF Transcript_8048/g.19044 Transcript_8048/m.19044 type:complete len:341 (-) Transcript_8048:1161-2183(-)
MRRVPESSRGHHRRRRVGHRQAGDEGLPGHVGHVGVEHVAHQHVHGPGVHEGVRELLNGETKDHQSAQHLAQHHPSQPVQRHLLPAHRMLEDNHGHHRCGLPSVRRQHIPSSNNPGAEADHDGHCVPQNESGLHDPPVWSAIIPQSHHLLPPPGLRLLGHDAGVDPVRKRFHGRRRVHHHPPESKQKSRRLGGGKILLVGLAAGHAPEPVGPVGRLEPLGFNAVCGLEEGGGAVAQALAEGGGARVGKVGQPNQVLSLSTARVQALVLGQEVCILPGALRSSLMQQAHVPHRVPEARVQGLQPPPAAASFPAVQRGRGLPPGHPYIVPELLEDVHGGRVG